MSLPDLPSLADQISADPVPNLDDSNSKDRHFSSRRNPERLGNVAPIAYGGCIIAIAVHSAHLTLPPPPPDGHQKFHLYSVLGTFHGPTKVDRKLDTTVTITRSTKTFATRRVVASQLQDDHTTRVVADFFIDFHAEEPALLSYDPSPLLSDTFKNGPTDPKYTASSDEILQTMQSDGRITAHEATSFRAMFRMAQHYFEMRHCLSGASAHNLFGLSPRSPTPQDHLPTSSKTSYEWLRAHAHHVPSLSSEALNMTALSFLMDQALSFVPLNHDHKGFGDAGACSTLEFALRVFVPDVKIGEWHLRERRTVQAGMGRTFSEARMWDGKERLVCSMSQACILRPPVVKEKGKGGSKI